MAIYVPIVMYGPRLFIVNYIHCLPICAHIRSELEVSITSPSVVALHLLISQIVKCIT